MSEICVTASTPVEPAHAQAFPALLPSRLPAAATWLRSFALAKKDVFLTIDAPCREPSQLLRLGDGDGFLYQPPRGPQFAGLGEALRLEARGENRFDALIVQATAAGERIVSLNFSASAARPLFFGGLAFAPGSAAAGPWAPFGDASFVLPRWLYRRQSGRATLSLCLRAEEVLRRAQRDWLAELQAMAAALEAHQTPPVGPGTALDVRFPNAGEVARRVGAVGREIAAARLEKVVLAQALAATLPADNDPLATFGRLAAASADNASTPFLFRRGGSTFLGATPELLIERQGLGVRSEALAGSSAAGELAAEELWSSRKNGHEHDIVARAIAEALAPLCRRLEVAPKRLRHLRRMAHLFTPIEGELAAPRHLLSLAARLHPTPAVGGWPKPAALTFLSTVEPEPRGWYAGPVGYFDTSGEGELRVALRCGIVRGRAATIYAGAGIVAGSVAAEELAEMVAKARPMLDALGGVRAHDTVHASFTQAVEDPTNGPRKTSGRSRAA